MHSKVYTLVAEWRRMVLLHAFFGLRIEEPNHPMEGTFELYSRWCGSKIFSGADEWIRRGEAVWRRRRAASARLPTISSHSSSPAVPLGLMLSVPNFPSAFDCAHSHAKQRQGSPGCTSQVTARACGASLQGGAARWGEQQQQRKHAGWWQAA